MGQEMARIHARGYHDGGTYFACTGLLYLTFAPVAGGTMIGLPAIKNFAKPSIRDRVLQEVMDGKKLVSLAITEAFAGSDVAGIRTTATKSADGKTWTVTGTF